MCACAGGSSSFMRVDAVMIGLGYCSLFSGKSAGALRVLHAALGPGYGIGDDDFFHEVAVRFEAYRLPRFRGKWIQLWVEIDKAQYFVYYARDSMIELLLYRWSFGYIHLHYIDSFGGPVCECRTERRACPV